MDTREHIENLVTKFVRGSEKSNMTSTQILEAFNKIDGTVINDLNLKTIRRVLKDKGFKKDTILHKVNGELVKPYPVRVWLVEINN